MLFMDRVAFMQKWEHEQFPPKVIKILEVSRLILEFLTDQIEIQYWLQLRYFKSM